MSELALKRVSRWALVFCLLLTATGFMLTALGWEAEYDGWGFRGFPSLLSLPFALTGILILNQLPRHGVGWVFLALGLVSAIQGLLFEYMLFSLILYPDLLPGGIQVAWVLEWYWLAIIYLITLILMLFPSGAPPSRRWNKYLFFIAIVMIVFAGTMALTPGPLSSSYGALQNPYGIEAFRAPQTILAAGLAMVMAVAFGPPLISLIIRFRNAVGVNRQQYKWFVFAAFLIMVTSILSGTSTNLSVQLLFVVSALLLPVALTIAVLRYRLFDIDIIIRGTISYAVLTAILAITYFSVVVFLQGLFEGLFGRADSPLISVLSTLAIAALFNPVRIRIQDFIDQRFYRSKYDAEKALEAFSQTTRDEVDMGALSARLVRVIEETMQPDKVQLLLKTTNNRQGKSIE